MSAFLSATLEQVIDAVSIVIIALGIVHVPPPVNVSISHEPQAMSEIQITGAVATISTSTAAATADTNENTPKNASTEKRTQASQTPPKPTSRAMTLDANGCPLGTMDFLNTAQVNVNDTVLCTSAGETSFLFHGEHAKMFSIRYGHVDATRDNDVVYPAFLKVILLPSGQLVQAADYLSLPDRITSAVIDRMVEDIAGTATKAHTAYPLTYMQQRGLLSGPDSDGRFCAIFDGKKIVHGMITVCVKPGTEAQITGHMKLNSSIYPFAHALETAHALADPIYIEQAKAHPYPFSSDLLTWVYRSDDGGYWIFELLEWQDSVTYPHTEKLWNWINDHVLVRVNSDGQGCVVKAGHVATLKLYDTTGDLLHDVFECPSTSTIDTPSPAPHPSQ